MRLQNAMLTLTPGYDKHGTEEFVPHTYPDIAYPLAVTTEDIEEMKRKTPVITYIGGRCARKVLRGIHPFIFLWEIVFHVFKLPITIKCRKLGSTACAHTFLVVLQKENSYTAASILIKKYLLRDNSPIEMHALNQTIQFLKLLLDDKLNIFLRSHVGSVFL